MEYKDYYHILGVARDASQDDIKRAYRKLARKYHPDVSDESDAEARFKEVGEAYEVLRDPEKRNAYDQFGSDWQAGQDFKPPPDWDSGFEFRGGGFTDNSRFRDAGGFSDFFESLFGQAAGASRREGSRAQGQDHQARVEIALEDAYQGASRAITFQTTEIDDQGRVYTKPRTLNVKVPKGVTAGQRIRLAEQGSPGMGGGPAGDLYLEIMFRPHRLFRVEGRDVHLELPVTPWEAALGASVTVPTLGGSVDLKIPAGSQSGKHLRLKAKGLPGNPPGNQYVILKIVIPAARTDAARSLYEQMAREMPMNPRADLGV